MQVEDTRYYRVSEVAEHFSVSVSTIYRAIESGQLDAVRLGTGVRVPGWAVLAYAEACGQAAYDTVAGSLVHPVADDHALEPTITTAARIEAFQHRTQDGAGSCGEVAR